MKRICVGTKCWATRRNSSGIAIVLCTENQGNFGDLCSFNSASVMVIGDDMDSKSGMTHGSAKDMDCGGSGRLTKYSLAIFRTVRSKIYVRMAVVSAALLESNAFGRAKT
jgi:hypothetical protein